MQLGVVIGHATSTVKHPSFVGWRLVLVQPLGAGGVPEAEPLVAIDKMGAGAGQRVVLSNDGRGAREMIGDAKSPVRWFVVAIEDERRGRSRASGAG
jgi:ethanolamine utilization protein EutN